MFKLDSLLKLWQLFKKAFGDYRHQLIALSTLGFISGILEGIGINAVIPLFSFVDKSHGVDTDFISQNIQKVFAYFGLVYTLKSLLWFIITAFVVKAVILYWATWIGSCITFNYEQNIRSKLFKLSLGADWRYLSRQKIGHLDQMLTREIGEAAILFSYLSSLILIVTNIVVYVVLVVNISLKIAIATGILSILIFLFFRPFFRGNKRFADKVMGIHKDVAHYVNENVIGMKTVKSASVEELVIEKGFNNFVRLKELNMKMSTLRNITNTLLQPIGLLFVIVIFVIFYRFSSFSFAAFAVAIYAINKVFANIQIAQSQIHRISSLVPYLTSILKYEDEIKNVQERISGDQSLFQFKQSIQFNNVDFSYEPNTLILKNVSFNVPRGSIVGLIGQSGGGKTTLVDLLERFFPVKGGKITIDDKNIESFNLREWRKKIGYVSQDVFLMNDTVENNIKFYNENLSLEELIVAAKNANIYDFIMGLPKKFQTIVGERGILLSGGQRQRIALARVLARKPEILILDEATSSLDNESEVLIQKSIEELRGKITIIVIAHRLSTVMIADNLMVLENGKIIEEGKPDELLKNKDSYFFRVNNLNA